MLVVVHRAAVKFCQTVGVKDVGVCRINLQKVFTNMRISAQQKLRKAVDFNNLRQNGLRSNCGGFVVVINKQETAPRRFGVITSRKVGNAVKRNYAKRIFRDIFRLNQNALPSSCDFLVVVRSNFDDYSYSELEARFLRACQQHHDNNK